jgi:hypothetical protein
MVSPSHACVQLPRVIQGQTFDSATAGTRQSFKMQAVDRPSKMARPPLSTWIEERFRNPRAGIDAGGKRQFFLLTGIAAQCQILQRRTPTTRFRHDVVKAQAMWEKAFRSVTIFATIAGTMGHVQVIAPKTGFPSPGHSFPQSALGPRGVP